MTDGRVHESGFTLIEVVIAFAILGVATSILFPLLSPHQLRLSRSENERIAVLTARSVLDSVGAEIPLAQGTREGKTTAGAEWTLSMAPYEPDADTATDASKSESIGVYIAHVQAVAGKGSASGKAELVTVRLKPEVR